MRVYYLRIPSTDFVRIGETWTSPLIDLYNNAYYKNYSITRSKYGLNSLGTNIWTGIVEYGSGVTDTGIVTGGRYIDTSGRIVLENYLIDISFVGSTKPSVRSVIYTTPHEDAVFPAEYASAAYEGPSQDLFVSDADRYMRVIMDFTADSLNLGYSFEYLVRILIDEPVMGPFYERTRRVVEKFPHWSAIGEWDNNPATPSLATPNSVGAKFINAIAGQWLDELNSDMVYAQTQRYIDAVDLNQMAWAYKTEAVPQYIYSIVGDGVELAHATQEELYQARSSDHAVYWDENNKTIYTNKLYTSLLINGTEYVQTIYHIWNDVDDIALQVDLKRLTAESNENFRKRILDVFKNPLGVGLENFKLTLRRELDLWRADGATPDSDYLGATPSILEIEDLENDLEYWGPDGIPTKKFISIVDYLNRQYPTTWGRFKWDEALWDIGGTDREAYGLLPYRLDATPLPKNEVQPGVGDGQDLYVYRPDEFTGPHTFTYRLKARGRHKTIHKESPAIKFDAYIYGEADKLVYNNPTITAPVALEFVMSDYSVCYHNFSLSATSDYDVDNTTPSPESFSSFSIFGEDGLTPEDMDFYVMGTNTAFTVSGSTRISSNDVLQVRVHSGHFNAPSLIASGGRSSSDYSIWFADNPEDTTTNTSFGTATTALAITGPVEDIDFEISDQSTLDDTWTIVNAGWAVVNNAAEATTADALVVRNINSTSYVIELTYDTVADQPYGLVFNYVDINNYSYIFPRAGISGLWEYNVKVSGVVTTTTFTAEKTQSAILKVMVGPSALSVHVNSKPVFFLARSSTSGHPTSSLVGLISNYIGGRISALNISGASWPELIMQSTATSSSLARWQSEKQLHSITLNGLLPGNSAQDYTLPAPTIMWDNYLQPVPNKSLIVEIATSDGATYGGFTKDLNGDLFLESNYITLNDSNVWDNCNTREVTDIVSDLVFSTYTGYSDNFNRADQTLITGSWQNQGNGSWNVVNNEAQYLGSGTGIALVEGFRTGTASFTVGSALSGTSGLIFRYMDNSDYWALQAFGSIWKLVRVYNNMVTIATTIDYQPAIGQVVQITFNDTAFSISITGNPTVVFNDTNLIGSDPLKCGSGAGFITDNTVTTFDNFSIVGDATYPIDVPEWSPFEYFGEALTGTVDDNGPWHNDAPSDFGNTSYALVLADVARADFGVPESDDDIVTWIGVECLDDPQVLIWMDCNIVKPYLENSLGTYPSNAIVEDFVTSTYSFAPFTIKARLRADPAPEWNPQINSGYYYLQDKEYYLYAKPVEEVHATPTGSRALAGVNRQGAPIIIRYDGASPSLIQTNFFSEGSTPNDVSLSLANSEIVKGNGTTELYVAYQNLRNIDVRDLTTGETVDAETVSSSNRVTLSSPSNKEHEYEILYRVKNSFYANNEYIQDSTPSSLVVFESTPSSGHTYEITYESSLFNPATPVDLKLSPFYSAIDEGYIFISHNEYSLDKVIARVAPSKILGDGNDYILVTLNAVDTYGNPKPGQFFVARTNWGSFDSETTQTSINLIGDEEGFVTFILYSESSTSLTHGTISITGAASVSLDFEIAPTINRSYRLTALPSADYIRADGQSQLSVFGRVEGPDFTGISFARIDWSRARSVHDLFDANTIGTVESGSTSADQEGFFTVGPFTAATPDEPGYWFMSLISSSASPSIGATPSYYIPQGVTFGDGVFGAGNFGGDILSGETAVFDPTGDVIFWQEYPDARYGIENISGMPKAPVQMLSSTSDATPYATGYAYPAKYTDSDPDATSESAVSIKWLPPKWLPMDAYEQYQLGLYGSTPGDLDPTLAPTLHPFRRDI